MRVAVISSSPFIARDHRYLAYSPYVRELEIWARHSNEIGFMCPLWKTDRGLLISDITFPVAKFFVAKEFNLKTPRNILKAMMRSFGNIARIYRAMAWADHIHLRCPGNIGLLGCFVQILFPGKPKTAKYAGNWDPRSKQPLSYRLQKWILSNTFLTRNMKVLVYGEWPGSSKNIKPFFTASYSESDKEPVSPRIPEGQIDFVYVGTLVRGKRPIYAIKLIEHLNRKGVKATLSLYGHGKDKPFLADYITKSNLSDFVFLKGNQPTETVMEAYKDSHFVILPSRSEGWPKVIAEGMFWGCVPVATDVSCLSYMLDKGKRGILLAMNLEQDAAQMSEIVEFPFKYREMATRSIEWSRHFTLDLFEQEIKAMLKP